MKKLPLSKIQDFFAAIAKDQDLYIPAADKAGQAQYTKWEKGVEFSNQLNTIRSAKDFFFPQVENIVDFKMSGKTIEVIDASKEVNNFVIFGVRACDVTSFDILDKVFLAEPVDSFYKARREHGVIISMACTAPDQTCFCNLFEIDATEPKGDISSWKTDDEVFFEANTEKGKALLASLDSLLSDADTAKVEAQKKETTALLDALPFAHLKHDSFKAESLLNIFDSEKWGKLSDACIACGTCSFVCPTCQCYDIRDFDTGKEIKRFRCWDSCMYSDFTKMAHGNPRTTQLERFRQRFMHKLVYFPANNDGQFGCVGCGRCLVKCPVSMNIIKVMKILEEEETQC